MICWRVLAPIVLQCDARSLWVSRLLMCHSVFGNPRKTLTVCIFLEKGWVFRITFPYHHQHSRWQSTILIWPPRTSTDKNTVEVGLRNSRPVTISKTCISFIQVLYLTMFKAGKEMNLKTICRSYFCRQVNGRKRHRREQWINFI